MTHSNERFPTRIFTGKIAPLPDCGRPSAIFKHAVSAPLLLGVEGFDGDEQADRKVHGGPEKAVHIYPQAHYDKMAAAFPALASQCLPGAMGENLCVQHLDEDNIHAGDVFALGEARLQLAQARTPCWKIDARFGHKGVAAWVARSRCTGWYMHVLQSGMVQPDDELIRLEHHRQNPSLAAALAIWQTHRPALASLESLLALPGIANHWQQKIRQRIQWLQKNAQQSPPPVTQFHPDPQDANPAD